MVCALLAFAFLSASEFINRPDLALENVALSQKLVVYQRSLPQPQLCPPLLSLIFQGLEPFTFSPAAL